MASDEELKNRINSNKALKSKYERVRNEIAIKNMDVSKMYTVSAVEDYIEDAKTIYTKIEGDAAFSYLNEFARKVHEDTDTMQEYIDYLEDASTSYVNLYTTLESEIATLNQQIKSDRDAYNKDKWFWEKIYW